MLLERNVRRYPFGDPLPRVVPGEVIASAQLEPPPPRPSPTPRSAPDDDDGEPAPEPDPAAAVDSGPSVAILTLREVRPIADYGGVHEAEDVLVEALSARLYRVVLSDPRYGRPPFDKPVLRRALNASRLVRPYRIEHRGQGAAAADILLVLAKDLGDAAALVGVPGWYELGQCVMVHIEVVTERDLRRYPELVSMLRRRVDAVFSGTEMPPLGHLRSERLDVVGVVPPTLDVLAFPAEPDRERTIDVFSPAPAAPDQRRLLTHWANTHNGKYQQDVGQLGAITSHSQHRKVFTTMATRSRLFLTNYDQFDHRRHAGQHREAGARFYDAMAAGCVLFGDLPAASRQFVEYIAPAGPLPLPRSAAQLPSDLVNALTDRAESDRLGTLARAAALRRGDAAHRWVEMATMAGQPIGDGIHRRINHLAALAEPPP
ncbi:MAG TPA: hypothetical protein VGH89_23950 [Pseudonocardia sp.]|jgi:hypothetical protein